MSYSQVAQNYINEKYLRPPNWADPCSQCIKPCDPTCNPCVAQPPLEPCALPFSTTVASSDACGNYCTQTVTGLASPFPYGTLGPNGTGAYLDPIVGLGTCTGPNGFNPYMTPYPSPAAAGACGVPGAAIPGTVVPDMPVPGVPGVMNGGGCGGGGYGGGGCGGGGCGYPAPAVGPGGPNFIPLTNVGSILNGVPCGTSCIFQGPVPCPEKKPCRKKKSCGNKSCNKCSKKSCKKSCDKDCDIPCPQPCPPPCVPNFTIPVLNLPCGTPPNPAIGPCDPALLSPIYPAELPPTCPQPDPCFYPWARGWPWVRNSWYVNNSPYNSMI